MSPFRRSAALAVGLALTGIALTGCVAGGGGWSDLEREPSVNDTLPTAVDTGDQVIDEASVRFVGEYQGTRLWLMKSRDGMCLVQYPDSREWSSVCSGPGEFGSMGPGGDFVAIPDGGHPPDGAIQISANVYSKR